MRREGAGMGDINFHPPGEKPKIVIVENTDAIEQQARDVADAQMTDNLEDEPKGFFKKAVSKSFWKNTGKKIWKQNLWYDVYRQKKIQEARKKIGEGEDANLYANEYGGDRSAHLQADKALVDRFMATGTAMEADMIHTTAGEQSETLGEWGEEGRIKRALQTLIKDFARGNITEQQFLKQKAVVFGRLKTEKPDVFNKGKMYADNLLDMAKWARNEVEKQIAQAIDQAEAIRRLDLDFDVVIGKAKTGVRTEAQFNIVDKITDKIQSTIVGRFVSNDVTATATAIAYSVVTGAFKGSASVAKKLGGFVGGLAVGAGLGGLRESRRLEIERAQHAREMAQGKEVAHPAKAEKRKALEESRIQTKSVKELITGLDVAMHQAGTTELKNFTPDELKAVVEQLAEIEARIEISDEGIRNKDISKFRVLNRDGRYKVDLISFSHITKVEAERMQLDVARARAKVMLRKFTQTRNSGNFNTNLQTAIDAQKAELMGGTKGIKEQNEKFTKYKRKEVAKAVVKRVLIGGALGLAYRELSGLADGRGLFGGFGPDRTDSEVTPLEGARKAVWNYLHDTPHTAHAPGFHEFDINGHHFKFPNGIELKPNGSGGYDLVDSGKVISDPANPLHLDSAGNFDSASKNYLTTHGFNPHETSSSIASGIHHADPAETKKLFPNLGHHARVDWHDEAGKYWSEIHKQFLEFEGKQQMGYLEKIGDRVYLNCHKVIDNFIENVKDNVNNPNFGAVPGYTNPDGSVFVDPKMAELKEQILEAIQTGELQKQFQAVIIPTDGANQEGLSDLIQGADGNGRIDLGPEWSKYFTDPKMLHDGHLPFRFLEMRFNGHVMATAQGLPEGLSQITTSIDHPEIAGDKEDFEIITPPAVIMAGRRPLEGMRPELPFLYGYGYGKESKQQMEEREKVFKKYRSKTLEKDPKAKLDHFKEAELYFKRQSREYMAELATVAEQAGRMRKDCRLSICIPVAGHQEGKNIYKSLENYCAQTANKTDYEIVLFVNHPEEDRAGNKIKPDKTIAEIERFKTDHPDMPIKVMYQVLPIEKAKIGYVRKLLNDAVLLRHHQRGDLVPDLIMVSNDADNKGVAPEYVQNFISKFNSHEDVEGYLGQLDWDPEAYTKSPVVHLGTRFFQYMNIYGRRRGSGIMVSSGANFAFRSSIYAGVGGYLDNALEGGEDINLGWAIASARKQYGNYDIEPNKRVIQFAGPKVSRIYTSARRSLHAWERHGLAPVHQWDKGFSAFDDEVRNIDAGGGTVDYDDPETLRRLKTDLEKVLNQSLDDYVQDADMTSKDHPVYQKVIGNMGIKYELDLQGNLVITDMTRLVAGLKEYQEYALAQRKAKSGDVDAKAEFKAIRDRQAVKRQEKIQAEIEAQKLVEEETTRKVEGFYATNTWDLPNLPQGITEAEVMSAGQLEDLDDDYMASEGVKLSDKETGKVIGGLRKADKKPVIVKKMTAKQVADAKQYSFKSEGVEDVEEYLQSQNLTHPALQMPERSLKQAGELIRIYEAGVQDLDNYLLAGNTLSPKNAVSLMVRICDAVRKLHKLEVVHGDVSPSNIILFKEGVKLGDLDSASIDTSGKGMFGRKTVSGNRFVMPPEMFNSINKRGNIRFGKSADIYQAGVTLFRLITGKWPYDIESTQTRRMEPEQRMEKYKKLHESGNINFPPSVPTAIQAIIKRAMQPKVFDRFASMDEMTSALVDAYANL